MVVGHDPEEEDAETASQKTGGEEDDFPRLDDAAVFAAADRNAVGEEAAEDLGYVSQSTYRYEVVAIQR